jgi:hypothetical protein
MQKEKPRSFRLSGIGTKGPNAFGDISKKDWWQFKKMSRTEYRNTAGLCLLAGLIIHILFPVGIISGIIWIYKVIMKEE